MFDDIVREYDKVDDRCNTGSWGHPKSSSRLLVLGALRVLAQYLTFSSIYELNGVSGDKNSRFFHGFTKWFSKSSFAEKFLKFPTTDEEIEHVSGYYRRPGVPGCIGSFD
jgi:hypothetical protein